MMNEHRLEAVADFICATLGMISQNIRAVVLEFRGPKHCIAHFSLWEQNDVTLEDIEQMVDDFEAAQPVGVRIEQSVKIYTPGESDVLDGDIFPIYMSKEAKASNCVLCQSIG